MHITRRLLIAFYLEIDKSTKKENIELKSYLRVFYTY